MLIVAILILMIISFASYLDLKYFHNPFSLFIWNLFSIFSTFIVPSFFLEIRPYAEIMPYRIWDGQYGIFPMCVLMAQVSSFVFFYFSSIKSFSNGMNINADSKKCSSSINLRASSQILVLLGVCVYLISFIDLFVHWIKEPNIGSLYYRMKGHGWANFLLSSLILYMATPMLSIQGKMKKVILFLFFLHFIYLGIFMSRLTQSIKFLIVILIILFNPFKRIISLRTLLIIGMTDILGLLAFRVVEFFSNFGVEANIRNFIPFFLEQNAGLMQELAANFYYAPAGFELNPLFMFRHFPFPSNFHFIYEFNDLHNGGVEEWVYGIKKSSIGGMPFLPLTQNYFMGGIPLTILFSAISGILLGKIAAYMNDWAIMSKNNNGINYDLTLGFYALIWYIYPGFTFPGPIPIIGLLVSLMVLGKVNKVRC